MAILTCTRASSMGWAVAEAHRKRRSPAPPVPPTHQKCVRPCSTCLASSVRPGSGRPGGSKRIGRGDDGLSAVRGPTNKLLTPAVRHVCRSSPGDSRPADRLCGKAGGVVVCHDGRFTCMPRREQCSHGKFLSQIRFSLQQSRSETCQSWTRSIEAGLSS
jgi:hypothetical protein